MRRREMHARRRPRRCARPERGRHRRRGHRLVGRLVTPSGRRPFLPVAIAGAGQGGSRPLLLAKLSCGAPVVPSKSWCMVVRDLTNGLGSAARRVAIFSRGLLRGHCGAPTGQVLSTILMAYGVVGAVGDAQAQNPLIISAPVSGRTVDRTISFPGTVFGQQHYTAWNYSRTDQYRGRMPRDD